jgi:hypothetical protein
MLTQAKYYLVNQLGNVAPPDHLLGLFTLTQHGSSTIEKLMRLPYFDPATILLPDKDKQKCPLVMYHAFEEDANVIKILVGACMRHEKVIRMAVQRARHADTFDHFALHVASWKGWRNLADCLLRIGLDPSRRKPFSEFFPDPSASRVDDVNSPAENALGFAVEGARYRRESLHSSHKDKMPCTDIARSWCSSRPIRDMHSRRLNPLAGLLPFILHTSGMLIKSGKLRSTWAEIVGTVGRHDEMLELFLQDNTIQLRHTSHEEHIDAVEELFWGTGVSDQVALRSLEHLLQAGVRLTKNDSQRLVVAALRRQYIKTAVFLVRNGCMMDVRMPNGNTPLQWFRRQKELGGQTLGWPVHVLPPTVRQPRPFIHGTILR